MDKSVFDKQVDKSQESDDILSAYAEINTESDESGVI